MKNIIILLLVAFELLLLSSCRDQSHNRNGQTPVVTVKTTLVTKGDIENSIILNGKTVYLKKNSIFSPIAGYISKINIKYGDRINKNDLLFEIQTKENKALENTPVKLKNAGIIQVLSPSSGVVNKLYINETGTYTTGGSLLCSIVEDNNLSIQVNVPYRFHQLITTGKKCKIFLPDNTGLDGTVYKIIPVINEASQTQDVLIKLNSNRNLPDNLNLTVQFVSTQHTNSCLLPKKAVLTNETLDKTWVMKIVNDNMAVKVPVIKGIENDSIVEIISPRLSLNDTVIIEGSYGLPDSSVVKLIK